MGFVGRATDYADQIETGPRTTRIKTTMGRRSRRSNQAGLRTTRIKPTRATNFTLIKTGGRRVFGIAAHAAASSGPTPRFRATVQHSATPLSRNSLLSRASGGRRLGDLKAKLRHPLLEQRNLLLRVSLVVGAGPPADVLVARLEHPIYQDGVVGHRCDGLRCPEIGSKAAVPHPSSVGFSSGSKRRSVGRWRRD